MKLSEYKATNKLHWHDVARLLSVRCARPVYEHRLNSLRKGATPTMSEMKALDMLTNGAVRGFKG